MSEPVKPAYLCMAPWTHTYISPQSERRLCCASREPAQNFKQYIDTEKGSGVYAPVKLAQWWNSEQVRSVRRKMMNGEMPSECQVCNHKLLNTDVYRSYFWHLFKHLYEDIWETTDDEGFTTMEPISWDYRFTNTCNFKCRMCGDMLSSAWEVEVLQNNMVNLDNPQNSWMLPDNRKAIREFSETVVENEFADAVEAKTVREIYWVGGEPLAFEQHWKYMNRIVELDYAHMVRARYNTNLSIVKNKKGDLYETLKKFADWEICASLDGTGDIGEYIRSGLNWQQWVENFEAGIASQSKPGQMRIDFTLTMPGMFEIENIVDLSLKYNVPLLSKVVFAFSPNIVLSPLALPKDVLVDWVNDIQNRIRPKVTHKQQSMMDILEQLKQRPTFAEEWPDTYEAGLAKGKKHILKLETIRKGAKLNVETIYAAKPEILHWWNNI